MKEPAALRRVSGVRGFLFDGDRVLHVSSRSVPGTAELLGDLAADGTPVPDSLSLIERKLGRAPSCAIWDRTAC